MAPSADSASAVPPPPARRRPELLAGLSLACAALVAYAPGLGAPFVYDDEVAIVQNPTLRHWISALAPPHGGMTVEGRPVLNFSFALNYALSGLHPWSYHLFNLGIHLAAGLALFGIARRAFAGRIAPAVPAAFALALLWTVDPLQTESVTYISQRAESLMGMFFLLTLYCFIRGVEAGAGPGDGTGPEGRAGPGDGTGPEGRAGRPRPAAWFGLAWLCCLLGMGTKEVMVTAPVIVLAYDRTFLAGSLREAWRRRGRVHLALMATWIPLILLVIGTGANRGHTAGLDTGEGWGAYLATQAPAILHYLRLSLWPHPLAFDYGVFRTSPAEALPGALVVGLLGAAALAALWRRPAWGFLGLWFFGILAPTSLVPSSMQMMAEHRMYLSLAAVLAAGVALLFCRVRPRAALWTCLALAAVFAVLTVRRNELYASPVSLWGDTVAKRPGDSVARGNLGAALFQSGQVDEAIEQYRDSARLDPTSIYARLNLANALAVSGRLSEAIDVDEEALRIQPAWAGVHCQLADLLSHAGRLADARSHYQAALRIRPDYPEAENGLGAVLFRLGQPAAALEHVSAALRLNPGYAEAYNSLGTILAASRRLSQAVAAYRRAVQLKPVYPEAHYNLGNVLAQTGDYAGAVGQYQAVLEQQGDSPGLRDRLGIVLAEAGRPSEARAQFEQALRLKPGDPDTLRILEQFREIERSSAHP